MERIRFITHRDQRILLADISGCTAQELAHYIDKVPERVTKEPPHSVLLLADFSGSEITRENVERLKIATAFDRPHVQRSAWVFNGNLPKTLFESIGNFSARNIAKFETREEALDYLVS